MGVERRSNRSCSTPYEHFFHFVTLESLFAFSLLVYFPFFFIGDELTVNTLDLNPANLESTPAVIDGVRKDVRPG